MQYADPLTAYDWNNAGIALVLRANDNETDLEDNVTMKDDDSMAIA